MSEISLSGDLERVSRTGYNNSKNREKNILIIYAPYKGAGGVHTMVKLDLSKNREKNILIIYAP